MASQRPRYDNEGKSSHQIDKIDRNPSMSENYELSRASIPMNVQRAAANFRLAGNIGFWVQIVLGAISGVTFLFASTALLGTDKKTQGIEFGIFCAFCGIIMLAISIFFSLRYGRVAKQLLQSDRPKKADTWQLIKLGLSVNLIGMLLAILGSASLAGIVLLKALTTPPGTLTADPTRYVNSLDMLVIQANINAIIAHFGGIVTTLWLLNRIAK
jgi:hypothetical protein